MTNWSDPLIINKQPIKAGERSLVMVDMPKLYDCTPISMPIHVLRGNKPGPTLCVIAAIHGDEINGVEIIKLLLKNFPMHCLSGTLIAVPIINIYGFLYQTRYLMDRRDLNRCFPGSETGSLAARLAHLVMKDIISHATHIIDLHTGSLHRTNYPQIRANLSEAGVLHLAEAFDADIILHSPGPVGSLRLAAEERKIPIIVYEAGEALRFDDPAITVGHNGILNVMEELGMLPKDPQKKISTKTSAIAQASYWVRSPHSGILRMYKTLGDTTKDNEIVGILSNPVGEDVYDIVVPHGGIIIGKSNIPIVHEGAALFHIATFDKLKYVEDEIINHKISLDPNLEAFELTPPQSL
jgi:hypothetical protein